jgi:glycosyltransferase involved in cell wall biosynthesis
MKNIVIILNGPIPGLANTNRVLGIARGLKSNNINVKVLSYSILFNCSNNNISKYKSVPYYCLTFKKQYSRLTRIFLYIYNIFILMKYTIRKSKMLDCIYLYTDNLMCITLFGILSKLYRIKIVIERTEHPYYIIQNKKFKNIYKFLYTRVFGLMDGLVIISKELEYYKSYLKGQKEPIIVPIIIETDLFQNIITNKNIGREYIAYCGDMNGYKDNVQGLILSFSLIVKQFPYIDLILLGPQKNNSNLHDLVKELKLNERVKFLGNVDRECLLTHLYNAKILALYKYDNIQNKGNFPSKIAEYLLTGKPVLTTSIGVLTDYLIDKKNAYLVKPDDICAYAKSMEHILMNYKEALSIGKCGKHLAIDVFDFKKAAQKILNYINSLSA